jgi:hypothetical protein
MAPVPQACWETCNHTTLATEKGYICKNIQTARADGMYFLTNPHIKSTTFNNKHLLSTQNHAWKDLPGHRNGKLFIGGPCKKRADDLLKLSRHKLRMVVAILTGHTPVRMHLRTMGLFKGNPTCRFCRQEDETVQHIICCCEVLAHQHFNVLGDSAVEPKDISTASVRDLYLFI